MICPWPAQILQQHCMPPLIAKQGRSSLSTHAGPAALLALCLCRQNSLTAHLITPAKGAHFTMYLVQMKEGGKAAQLAPTVERYCLYQEP